MSVKGLDDLLKNLKTVEQKVAKKLVKKAVDAGGGVVLKAFKANVPAGNPDLENIKRAAGKKTVSKAGVATSIIGVRKQYQRDRKTKQRKLSATGKRIAKAGGTYPTRIFHLFEKGTKQRQTKAGKNTGKITKVPMLGPAVDNNQSAITSKMADVLRDGLASI